jgi:hypothetical protein
MKLALFKNISVASVYESALSEAFERINGYVRISEYVDVDFPSLPAPGIIAAQVAQIDQQIDKAMAVIHELGARKQELLALTGPDAAAKE